MSEEIKRLIEGTVASPGWNHIVALAQARIDRAKLAALNTRDPEKYAVLHAAAWAAQDALYEFLQSVTQDQEPNEHTR